MNPLKLAAYERAEATLNRVRAGIFARGKILWTARDGEPGDHVVNEIRYYLVNNKPVYLHTVWEKAENGKHYPIFWDVLRPMDEDSEDGEAALDALDEYLGVSLGITREEG